jgi:hypothetical protein
MKWKMQSKVGFLTPQQITNKYYKQLVHF